MQPRSAARCGAGCAPGSVQKGKAGAPFPFNAQACWPNATLGDLRRRRLFCAALQHASKRAKLVQHAACWVRHACQT